MSTQNSLRDLLADELQDLLHAENQLIKALPKMTKAAYHPALKAAFSEHLEETHHHVTRLEQAMQTLSLPVKGKTCHAMKGLVEEGAEHIRQKASPAVRDAGLIGTAQKIEHYEIAGYGTVRTYAQLLGEEEVARLLQETLNEEGETDKKLTKIALSLNVDAALATG
ncbi:MAG TPA: ferritin-like domain-containing protein [Lacunisphaera sp.]|nr:ferritin-like domain-containing protein [Lacunisphaera sp.]